MSNQHLNGPEYLAEQEISLLDYVGVIVKHRRMILGLCSTAVITALIVSLLLPKIYQATAVIMPPKSEETMSDLAAKMGGLASLAGGMLGVSNSAEIYVEMLKSRTIANAIIDKFDLINIYKLELAEDVREKLEGNTDFQISKANTISVTVGDRDPQRAADIANAYVEEVDKLNQKLNISSVGRQRVFLEQRLDEAKQGLSRAENELKDFQEKNGLVALDEQAKASIAGAAQIKAEIIATETELDMLKGFATGKETVVVKLQQKKDGLKEQLAKIERGEKIKVSSGEKGSTGDRTNFYLSFDQLPKLGLQLGRLMREVKIQETVFELLTQQYELARIAEAKDTSTIQILDKAVAPEGKSKPKRTLIVVLSAIVTFFASIFLAFIYEYFDRMNAEDKQRWQAMKSAVKGSIPFTGKEKN